MMKTWIQVSLAHTKIISLLSARHSHGRWTVYDDAMPKTQQSHRCHSRTAQTMPSKWCFYFFRNENIWYLWCLFALSASVDDNGYVYQFTRSRWNNIRWFITFVYWLRFRMNFLCVFCFSSFDRSFRSTRSNFKIGFGGSLPTSLRPFPQNEMPGKSQHWMWRPSSTIAAVAIAAVTTGENENEIEWAKKMTNRRKKEAKRKQNRRKKEET